MREETEGPEITTPSGLKYVDLIKGHGPIPQPGQNISFHYVMRLENGVEVDSSRGGRPLETAIGLGKLIAGLEEGLMSMRGGGKRRLAVPPNLGYGAESSPKIPANSTLIIDVELIKVK